MKGALLAVGLALCLSGCSAAMWSVGSAFASYVASVNNLGAETLKIWDERHLPPRGQMPP